MSTSREIFFFTSLLYKPNLENLTFNFNFFFESIRSLIEAEDGDQPKRKYAKEYDEYIPRQWVETFENNHFLSNLVLFFFFSMD